MEVPTGAPDFNIDESNTEPVMDGAWDPVLRRIEELASAGLHRRRSWRTSSGGDLLRSERTRSGSGRTPAPAIA